MAKQKPNLGEFWCCTTGGALAKVIKITKWDPKQTTKTLDATDCDSGGYDEFLAGNKANTIDVEGRWETTESKLFGNPAVISNGATIDFECYIDKDNLPNEKWSGTGLIEALNGPTIDQGSGDALVYSFTIRVSGALTCPASA
jgi:hypothetical protein